MSLWFPLALLAALFTASGDSVLKKYFSGYSAGQMAVVRSTAPLPFLLPALFLVGWPQLDATFFITLLFLVPLEILALLLYMKALKVAPLSLSIPFLAFTPAFTLVTGWVLLGERVSPLGLAGVCLTVAGAYALHTVPGQMTLLSPFRSMAKEEGSRLMLAVAAIYSITSVLGKQAVLHSSPAFFACFYFLMLGFVIPLFLMRNPLTGLGEGTGANGREAGGGSLLQRTVARGPVPWIAVGLFQAAMVFCHMWAISLTQATYMIAVKRTSLLFSILYGGLVFREKYLLPRLAAGGIMILGVCMVVAAS